MTSTATVKRGQTVEMRKRPARYRDASLRDRAIHAKHHKRTLWVDDGEGGKCCIRCADQLVVLGRPS